LRSLSSSVAKKGSKEASSNSMRLFTISARRWR
jgi:hypothetical protein